MPPLYFFFFFLLLNLFIYLFVCFLAALGLRRCTRAPSSCSERGGTLCCGAWASPCGGPSRCRARALGARAAAVVVRWLSSCGTRAQKLWHTGSVAVARGPQSAGSAAVTHGPSHSTAHGIFPNQGSNPCPLHWQADS